MAKNNDDWKDPDYQAFRDKLNRTKDKLSSGQWITEPTQHTIQSIIVHRHDDYDKQLEALQLAIIEFRQAIAEFKQQIELLYAKLDRMVGGE